MGVNLRLPPFLATTSSGVSRLSLACGVIALIWVLSILRMADYGGGYWWLLALICLVSFLCPWGAVRVLAWIIAGFVSDVRKKPN
jgi:hypothetical protein